MTYYIIFIGSKLHSSHSRGIYKEREGERVGGGKKSQILLWGATGEQEWTPALTTGNLGTLKELMFALKPGGLNYEAPLIPCMI